MKRFILISFLLGGFILQAQDTFPESWLGKYSGELSIFSPDSISMKIEMSLEIKKTSSDSIFDWTLIYQPNTRNDVRAYCLVVVDRSKGHYQIDEKNSIILDAYLHNNKVFTSFFKVLDSYVIATYSKVTEGLVFEIIAAKGSPINLTGDSKFKGEQIPKVSSYLVNGRQMALLKKVKE